MNQIKEHLERVSCAQEAASTKQTNENPSCTALLAATHELIDAGKATSKRLAEVDVILTRLDNLHRELASAEHRVVQIASQIHSQRKSFSSSKTSLQSDVSEMESSNVQNVHSQLKACGIILSISSANFAGKALLPKWLRMRFGRFYLKTCFGVRILNLACAHNIPLDDDKAIN